MRMGLGLEKPHGSHQENIPRWALKVTIINHLRAKALFIHFGFINYFRLFIFYNTPQRNWWVSARWLTKVKKGERLNVSVIFLSTRDSASRCHRPVRLATPAYGQRLECSRLTNNKLKNSVTAGSLQFFSFEMARGSSLMQYSSFG